MPSYANITHTHNTHSQAQPNSDSNSVLSHTLEVESIAGGDAKQAALANPSACILNVFMQICTLIIIALLLILWSCVHVHETHVDKALP